MPYGPSASAGDAYHQNEGSWFQFVDDGNGSWGLARSDYSGKPPYAAVRDLIALLRDPGGSGTYPLGSLTLTLPSSPSSLHRILLRGSDGTWSLLLWNEVLSYDAGADLTVAPLNVTVGFGQTFAAVSVFRPLDGTAAITKAIDIAQITVAVPDHPLITRLGSRTGAGDLDRNWRVNADDLAVILSHSGQTRAVPAGPMPPTPTGISSSMSTISCPCSATSGRRTRKRPRDERCSSASMAAA